MTFTIEDFQDLLRLLDEHPEWQAELRQRLIAGDLHALPAIVRDLAQAQARTEQRLDELAQRLEALTRRVEELTQAQARTEQRLEELAQAQARTEQRLEELTQAQARTEQRLEELALAQARTEQRVGDLVIELSRASGRLLEMDYRDNGPSYFSLIARRLRVIVKNELSARLDDAVDAGRLTEGEKAEVLWADVVLEGRRRQDQADVFIVVEVSRRIARNDIERALARSQLLTKLGKPAIPVVAGEAGDDQTQRLARTLGVWWLVNGHPQPPEP